MKDLLAHTHTHIYTLLNPYMQITNTISILANFQFNVDENEVHKS